MSATPKLSRAEQARLNGAKSHGPVTPEGKARAAQNATRHGLRSGPFALLPGEDAEALAALHRCVAADWRPRDAYERHWVGEIVASLWRANRLRRLEIEHLDAVLADPDLALAEATVRKLATYARYGARLDADLKRALGALRVLKERPDAQVAAGVAVPDVAVPDDTHEPDMAAPGAAADGLSVPDDTREPAPRRDRGEPKAPAAGAADEAACTNEPEPAAAAAPAPTSSRPELRLVARDTAEPAPRRDRGEAEPPAAMPEASAAPRLNRKARRRQQALLRKAQR